MGAAGQRLADAHDPPTTHTHPASSYSGEVVGHNINYVIGNIYLNRVESLNISDTPVYLTCLCGIKWHFKAYHATQIAIAFRSKWFKT